MSEYNKTIKEEIFLPNERNDLPEARGVEVQEGSEMFFGLRIYGKVVISYNGEKEIEWDQKWVGMLRLNNDLAPIEIREGDLISVVMLRYKIHPNEVWSETVFEKAIVWSNHTSCEEARLRACSLPKGVLGMLSGLRGSGFGVHVGFLLKMLIFLPLFLIFFGSDVVMIDDLVSGFGLKISLIDTLLAFMSYAMLFIYAYMLTIYCMKSYRELNNVKTLKSIIKDVEKGKLV